MLRSRHSLRGLITGLAIAAMTILISFAYAQDGGRIFGMWGIEITAKLRPSPPCIVGMLGAAQAEATRIYERLAFETPVGTPPGRAARIEQVVAGWKVGNRMRGIFRVRALGKAEDEHVRVAAQE